jgi:hypothetical protein
MFKRLLVKFVIVFLAASLAGCASIGISDLFSGYAQQMQASRSAQFSGDFIKAESSISVLNQAHNNYGLNQLERGRLQFLANNWQASQKSFELAYREIEIQEAAAKIQLSKGVKKLGAVMSNDNAIAYEIPRYEQSMLHSYQALNYLYQGSLEGALVEVRRANLVQERALRENQAELYDAQDKMASKGVTNERLNSSYPSMNSTIGDLKNGFQNAYTFYLSGLLYEAAKQPNDAYIDYKRAIEIFPNNTYLQQDLLRLATKLGMYEDLAIFNKRFGKYRAKTDHNTGQVVVIYEQGIVNAKDEAKLNLPLFNKDTDMKFFSFALPVYRGGLAALTPLSIDIEGRNYQSQEIVRIQSLASKDLQENLAGLVTRQAIRLVAKEQVRKKMSKAGGDVGNILASLYNIASERADTRSWSSLPDSVQLMKMSVPLGKQQLAFSLAGKQQMIDVDIKSKGVTLINVTSMGSYVAYQTINL